MFKTENVLNNYLSLLKDANEENIKIHVVIDFLELLGYKKSSFDFEYTLKHKQKADIYIHDEYSSLYVEVKRKDYNISQKDCEQLSNYLNISNISYGILTNGNYFYLIDNTLRLKAVDKCILLYILNCKNNDVNYRYKYTNKNILPFFTKDNIFIKKTTKYFSYYTSFINNSTFTKRSIPQYQSAIFKFIYYLDNKFGQYDDSLLSSFILDGYIKHMASRGLKYTTLCNNGRYIAAYIKYLEENKFLQTKNFSSYKVEDHINNISEEYNNISTLTIEESNKLIDYYSSFDKSDSLRNILIYKIFLYMCPSIETICNLKVDDINIKLKSIYVNNERIYLPNSIISDLEKYLKYRNDKIKKSDKFDYLFFTYYGKSYNKISYGSLNFIINDCFSRLNTLTPKRAKELTINTIQKSVIINLLKEGFSIEEINILTGISFHTLSNYLTDDIIKERRESLNEKLKNNKHPYFKAI